MSNFIIVGHVLTYIPFYMEIAAEDEKVAMREVKESMQTRAGVAQDKVVVDKIIQLPETESPNVN